MVKLICRPSNFTTKALCQGFHNFLHSSNKTSTRGHLHKNLLSAQILIIPTVNQRICNNVPHDISKFSSLPNIVWVGLFISGRLIADDIPFAEFKLSTLSLLHAITIDLFLQESIWLIISMKHYMIQKLNSIILY